MVPSCNHTEIISAPRRILSVSRVWQAHGASKQEGASKPVWRSSEHRAWEHAALRLHASLSVCPTACMRRDPRLPRLKSTDFKRYPSPRARLLLGFWRPSGYDNNIRRACAGAVQRAAVLCTVLYSSRTLDSGGRQNPESRIRNTDSRNPTVSAGLLDSEPS